MNKYNVTIGLEMHCELKSNSKVFSPSSNNYNEIPNTNVNEIDLAFPGILPTVNEKCVSDALKVALCLNCEIPEYMYFDRKNYYYPDLPKGYQITQNTEPVGVNGNIDIDLDGKKLNVLIHDVHLEEDSASMEHLSNESLIDYNRAGVPLLELVTEPCLHSADEAVAFLEYIRKVYQYLDVSDADITKGQIRCDVNVSISEDENLGTKVEVKNVNNFANVRETIEYEIKRQSELKSQGRYDEVEQETRRFDEESGTTIRMRSKVDAIDYKYFIEPNIPKYKIPSELIETIKNSIPELPLERKTKYINEYNLSEIDAINLIKEKSISDYFDKCIELGINPKTASNWIITQIMGYLNKFNLSIEDIYLTPDMLKKLIDNIESGNISSKQAKDIFNKVLDDKKDIDEYLKDNNQVSDKDELSSIIDEILNNNQDNVEAYKNGKTNLFQFFVGQVMKQTKGKANPVITKELLEEKLK